MGTPDVDAAIAVLREAFAAGENHIDTSNFYGSQVPNQIIKRAFSSHPDELVIVTKADARRGEDAEELLRRRSYGEPSLKDESH